MFTRLFAMSFALVRGYHDAPLTAAVRGALVEITKQDLGTGARRWRTWWTRHQSDDRIDWLQRIVSTEPLDQAELAAARGEKALQENRRDDAANLLRSRNRNPSTGGRIGGTGPSGGRSASSELTDSPASGANAAM